VLPPIPPQIMPSDGLHRDTMREPGAWLRENGVTPPEGSYVGDGDPKDFNVRPPELGSKKKAEASAAQGSADGAPAGDGDRRTKPRVAKKAVAGRAKETQPTAAAVAEQRADPVPVPAQTSPADEKEHPDGRARRGRRGSASRSGGRFRLSNRVRGGSDDAAQGR
jgi:hypothetical protein